jgi:hypothetical protein
MKRDDLEREALTKATTGQSFANFPAIIAGFTAKGIPEDQIRPRENVFTFHAWKALGRAVKRGEHGVRVVTFVQASKTVKGDGGEQQTVSFRRPWTTTVFHISQTEERTK